MRQSLLILLLISLILTGCQTFGKKLTDEHAQSHNIQIDFDENSKKAIKYFDIAHRLKNGQVYLTISGSVKRPLGMFASRMTVNLKLTDTQGNVVMEESQGVFLRRIGHTNRRYQGSFFVQIPDNPDIVKCTVEI